MAVTGSAPISITDLVTEFGGSAPHSLTEYYRGGSLVPDTAANASVPTSGAISLTQFYGASVASTTGNYTITIGAGTIGLGVTVHGFDAYGQTGSYGAISTNTIGFSGFNVTIGGVNESIYNSLTFYVIGHVGNSGWTSMTLGGTTFNRTAGSYAQGNSASFGGNYTRWSWSTSNVIATSGTVTVSWAE
jgi:hypothetical protein